MDSNINKILKDIFPHQFNIILIILCKALLKYPLRRKNPQIVMVEKNQPFH